MKRVIPVFLLTTIAAFIAAQPCSELFFSEYMEGTSNNKALEIFNPTTMPVNLAGYKVQLYTNGSSAVQTTLNLSGTVAPGDVYVIVNPQANATVKANRDTSSGVTNFNGNDAIALVKGTASIDIIGQIGVDPGASGWMLSGGGFTTNQTLVRRPQVHEGTTDWTLSSAQWVIFPVDTSFLGYHVQSPCPAPSDTVIGFSTASNTAAEDAGAFDIVLTLVQAASADKTIDVVLASGDSADIGNFTTQTVTIPSGSIAQILTISITNDVLAEGDELFVFQLANPSAGLLIGSDSIFTLTIADDDTLPAGIPHYPIAILTAVDSNGVADSSGVRCSVSGLVYGGNLRAAGLQFTIHDQTGGIGVFSSSADFGYSVEEGDSVVVVGVVAQFNGFTQMESLDTVYEAGTGMLPQPVNTVVLDESTESELVRINNVSLISPVQWNNSNPSGFSVDIRQGMINFFSMRIDEQTDLFSQNAPTGTFDVIGLGGQFDNSPPFTEGYQITPRSSADVILHTAAEELVSQKAFAVYPNPGSGIFHIRLKEQTKETFTLRVADLAGRVMLKSSQASDAGYLQINLSDAAEGLYLIEITGKSFTAKSRVNVMN